MKDIHTNQQLHFEHEVLWARYEIREHYLKTVVQDMYQSTGQILSLVQVQLSTLYLNKTWLGEKALEPIDLVGKAIHDLRDMCHYFSPENELMENINLVETIRHEIQRIGITAPAKTIKVKGEPTALSIGTELIVFRMLQEMLCSVKEHSKGDFTFKIDYTAKNVNFRIHYSGVPIRLEKSGSSSDRLLGLQRLALQDRAKLIGGKLQLTRKTNGMTQIKYTVPFKIPNHEY